MALYNAWCDRVPVYVMIGNISKPTSARPAPNGCTRRSIGGAGAEFLKWDDQPSSLQHFAIGRARLQDPTTRRWGVLLSLDAELQEKSDRRPRGLRIPRLAKVVPPQADSAAVAELPRCWSPRKPCAGLRPVGAHARGMTHLIELAETLNARWSTMRPP